jgi:hypothetical protein
LLQLPLLRLLLILPDLLLLGFLPWPCWPVCADYSSRS